MNTLGIYFGPRIISIVECKGRQPVNDIHISRPSISGEPLEDKVPEEVKIVPIIKDELRKHKIETEDVIICLSGKDLIIRTFEMPMLPRNELNSAVNLEARKYIPFKVEDLVSDFQCKVNKASRKNHILFVGIKKEILNKYLNICNQIGLKVKAIEYSAFSVLRLFSLANIRERAVIALFNIDLAEEDEVNFLVLEGGFPLFSRDITFLSDSQKIPIAEKLQSGMVFERLKREIRISLDYYDRTFSAKNISKVFFVMDMDYRTELENFIKETGLGVNFININKCIGKSVSFSLSFIKAYCSSIPKINTTLKIDLLSAKDKVIKKVTPKAVTQPTRFGAFRSTIIITGVCLLLCIIVYAFGIFRALPLQNEKNNIKAMRPKVLGVSPELDYEKLVAIDSDYKLKLKVMENLVKKQVYFTELLDVIPRIMPKDIRLIELYFKKDENLAELSLRGSAFLGDSDKELELVNVFLSHLKEDPIFTKYFKALNILSINRSQAEAAAITSFTISCRSQK